MPALAQQRCAIHTEREASSRCPSCQRYYCRECVTEHAGRMVCRACLSAAVQQTSGRRLPLQVLAPLLGFLLAWFTFYSLGRVLLQIPSEFHQP